jgi:hypothetical protein
MTELPRIGTRVRANDDRAALWVVYGLIEDHATNAPSEIMLGKLDAGLATLVQPASEFWQHWTPVNEGEVGR